MQVQNSKHSKQMFFESEINENVDDTLPLNEQVSQFQEKTSIQKRLIAEQTMQIYWLIAELRGRETELLRQ